MMSFLESFLNKGYFFLLTASPKAAPVENVGAAALEGSKAPVDLSFFALFLQADLVVKSVMLILIFASIWSWAIIFDKWTLLRRISSQTRSFEKNFWSGNSLENYYERVKGRETHPMALVFISAMQEWMNRSIRAQGTDNHLKIGLKERIYQTMQVTTNKAIDSMEKNLVFLATLGSTGTFIGLFGTVWGIMVSFQSIGASQSTSLAVVAPGIAEALLATVFGLAAAIPAMFFYNKFTTEVNRISSSLEDFSMELGSIMSKELDAR